MIIKNMVWDLEYAPRQSGKTSKIIDKAIDNYDNGKSVLLITPRNIYAQEIREGLLDCNINTYGITDILTKQHKPGIYVVSADNTDGILFDIFSVVLLDEFDFYIDTLQGQIIHKLNRHTGPNLLVYGLSTQNVVVKSVTFRDIVKQ
jgi:thymidine kinase